jgi:hypothetical protein
MSTRKQYTQSEVDVALINEKLTNIQKKVTDIDKKLDADYVTKDQMKIVESELGLLQKIVYGIVGLILTGVIGGMISFYINTPK